MIEAVASLLDDASESTVALYAAIRGEPDCASLRAWLAAQGRRALLPCVPSAQTAPLIFREHEPGEELVAGPLGGIPEPPSSRPARDPDLVLVPCAAFDPEGGRIGFGRGYYDATLKELRARRATLALGVAFSCQQVDLAPSEDHDEKLDAVVTEHGLVWFTPAGKARHAAAVCR
jgi:5-formyltetrahydrofolate cyclo-ligase